jgi:hypothetical protein
MLASTRVNFCSSPVVPSFGLRAQANGFNNAPDSHRRIESYHWPWGRAMPYEASIVAANEARHTQNDYFNRPGHDFQTLQFFSLVSFLSNPNLRLWDTPVLDRM